LARYQQGWLVVKSRAKGDTWALRYRAIRETDGKRTERMIPVGLVKDFPTEREAWMEVGRRQLWAAINEPDAKIGEPTFGALAHHYLKNELDPNANTVDPKAHTTRTIYNLIIGNYLLPRWGKEIAVNIQPLDVERWLQSVKRDKGLANPTLDKLKRVMSLVFKSAQRFGLISRREESNPIRFVRCKSSSNYEAVTITPEQAFTICSGMQEPWKTLTLLIAATGLRISEALGLTWADVDFAGQKVFVRRGFTHGEIGPCKTEASRKPVPMHPLLADFMASWKLETTYGKEADYVFASSRRRGKQPMVGSVMAQDHLRPAAVAAGVELEPGQRFGFHNLRHSLASFLVRTKTDPKTVQALLRHANVTTTLGLYAHANSDIKLAAQGEMLEAMLNSGAGAVQ
jgi:integrase